jgi:prepilin-type N-terminal cleavage/methylation domain-containing protein
MLNRIKHRQKGFTLIEVLIVVAVIAILGAIAVMTLNPAQASQKARDAQRRKDVAVYQSIIEQYLEDNRATFSAVTANTSGGTNACAGGVLRASTGTWTTCTYAATQPLDPINRTAQNITTNAGAVLSDDLFYEIAINSSGNYRICAHFESTGNAGALSADGGLYTNSYEIYNSTSSSGCTVVN